MTIIQPNKNKDLIKTIFLLGLLLGTTIIYGVFVYLQTVGLRHDLEIHKAELEKMHLENAEIKNKFFQLVDSDNLEKLAKEKGLVQEKNPQWASVSQF